MGSRQVARPALLGLEALSGCLATHMSQFLTFSLPLLTASSCSSLPWRSANFAKTPTDTVRQMECGTLGSSKKMLSAGGSHLVSVKLQMQGRLPWLGGALGELWNSGAKSWKAESLTWSGARCRNLHRDGRSRISTWLPHLLKPANLASEVTSLSLSFLTCQMGILTPFDVYEMYTRLCMCAIVG